MSAELLHCPFCGAGDWGDQVDSSLPNYYHNQPTLTLWHCRILTVILCLFFLLAGFATLIAPDNWIPFECEMFVFLMLGIVALLECDSKSSDHD